jgi:hypothetical protein
MSQNTARHDPRSEPEDEDVAGAHMRQQERRRDARPRQPAAGVGPDEPDEDEFELIGDDDLGTADLGPAAPNTRDPDAGSGRVRKITR